MRQRTKLQKNNAAQIIREGAAPEVCLSHRMVFVSMVDIPGCF